MGFMAKAAEADNSKAEVFFQRAAKLATSENFDYAIDMYLEGLRCSPDDVENGHKKLHQLGLARQAKGGKKPSMMEKVKRMRVKEPLEKLMNFSYLFAKDPDNISYAEGILKAATEGGYEQTSFWIADLVFKANNAADKPSVQTYILLKNTYSKIGKWDRALAACQKASQLKPDDGELADEFKRLSAELTVSKGKYDQKGDFRKSVNNLERQQEMLVEDGRVTKNKEARESSIEKARRKLKQEPQVSQRVFDLANALVDSGGAKNNKEAINLLEKYYKSKKDFSFKQKANEIRISNAKRKIRNVKESLEGKPDNSKAKENLAKLKKYLKKTELEHYRLCVENYPTDMGMKYEYGVRLFENGKYDEAIPLFQQAQRDPRHKIPAMSKMGMCFYMKQWYQDAIDIFNQAVESYQSQDDKAAKELRYNLAGAYEKDGQTGKALEMYRKLAQLDFGYKDVRKRVDNLRKSKQ